MSLSHRHMTSSFSPVALVSLPLVALLSGSACDIASPEARGELAPAFAEFDSDNVSVVLAGAQVTIESNGMPNHTSPYGPRITRCLLNRP